jgi:signal peptidase II
MRKCHLLIAALVLTLDRFSKWLVVRKIPLYGGVDVIPGLFRITHLENPGAAFSLFADFSGPWTNWLLELFSLAAVVVIAVLLWRSANVSLALVLGGTLGNLWDRLGRGRVTDFLDLFIGTHHWPPFNVADSAIVAGALLMLSKIFLAPQGKKAAG